MPKPVVLVHGAFLGAWAWSEVVAELGGRGVSTSAVDLVSQGPEGSLEDDAALVREVVAAAGEPVVLVGQSYGGMVITEASAANDGIATLVYVCAALPDEGDSVNSLMAADPHPTTLGEGIRTVGDGPMATLDPDTVRAVPAHDVAEAVLTGKLASMGQHQMGTFSEAAGALGHLEHPSVYVVTTEDRVFSPELQRTMAQRAGRTVDLAASHFPMFSKPTELAAVLAEVAAD